jgi:hypothetical protein
MKIIILVALVSINVFAYDECVYNVQMLNEEMSKVIISESDGDRVSQKHYLDMALIYNTNSLVKCKDKDILETLKEARKAILKNKEMIK